jgi:hypothetical protein
MDCRVQSGTDRWKSLLYPNLRQNRPAQFTDSAAARQLPSVGSSIHPTLAARSRTDARPDYSGPRRPVNVSRALGAGDVGLGNVRARMLVAACEVLALEWDARTPWRTRVSEGDKFLSNGTGCFAGLEAWVWGLGDANDEIRMTNE